MTFLDQLASSVAEMPQLSYEEINWELSQIHDGYFAQQISDFATSYESYSPYSSYSASPDYQPYSPPIIKVENTWPYEPKKRSPKAPRKKRSTPEAYSSAEIDEVRVAFKLKRIKLGLSQKQAAESVSKQVRKTSQTSLCRFENNQLHEKNMKSLMPHLKKWIELN